MKAVAREGARGAAHGSEASSSAGARLPGRPTGVGVADSGALMVGRADDPAEREADLLAERAIAGLPFLPPKYGAPPVSRKCAECEEEEAGTIRRTSSPGEDHHGGRAAPPAVSALLAQPGRRLDAVARSYFEARFKRSFGDVAVHDGASADRAARSIGASAFASGTHIAFASGQYSPTTPRGMRLLAHELAHVTQNGPRVVRRTRCGHDGRQPECGGGGIHARWILTDLVTGEVEKIAFDNKIVRDGLSWNFPGHWISQVQSPPNPRKSGEDRGFIDGVRLNGIGALKLEIVEIKSRATGCERATFEAQGYVNVLTPLRHAILDISSKLAPIGGVRVQGGWRPRAADSLILRQANVDLRDPDTLAGWKFYNGLQNRLNVTFATAFSDFQVELFTDGNLGQVYKAGLPVRMDCRTGRGRRSRPGTKARQLGFQVNKAGGVSYGCSDTPCQSEEEEAERQQQVQPVARPQQQPQGQASEPRLAAGSGAGDQGDVNDDQPGQQPHEEPSSIPVLVGFGTGAAALSAAAIAAYRRRAARIAAQGLERMVERQGERALVQATERAAANNVISLAERRAAQTAAQRLAAGRAAAGVAEKAVAVAAAAVAIILVAHGDAEASVGFGPSPFEALYEVMRRRGHAPSAEMKALIESDPVLRQLAEQAASGGDITAAQEAAARQVLQIVHDNPGAFSAEELEILRQASNGLRGGVSPQTREELRAAIDAAVARQGQPSPAGGGSGSAAGGGGQPATGPQGSGAPAPTGVSSGDLDEEARQARRRYPSLSVEMQGVLAAAPPAVRAVFSALTGRGPGVPIDDAVVREFLNAVPLDLTAAERDALIANVTASSGLDAAAILSGIRAAVSTLRSGQALGQTGAAPPPAGSPPAAEPGGATATPAGPQPATGPGGSTVPAAPAPPDADQRLIRTLRAAIDSYSAWASVPVNSPGRFIGEFRNAPVGTEVDLYHYVRRSDGAGNVVRAVSYLLVQVRRSASQRGQSWSGRVVSATIYLGDNGRTIPSPFVGQTIHGTIE